MTIICRYKYAYMEEMLGNVAGCRQVFERWMEWEPDEQAWHSYINFELRYKEVDRARQIHEKYILESLLFTIPVILALFFLGCLNKLYQSVMCHCAFQIL